MQSIIVLYVQYELFPDENPECDSIIHRLNVIRENMEQSRYKQVCMAANVENL